MESRQDHDDVASSPLSELVWPEGAVGDLAASQETRDVLSVLGVLEALNRCAGVGLCVFAREKGPCRLWLGLLCGALVY